MKINKTALLLLSCLLLTACSVKIAYNWLDYLIPWYLDDYVELNEEQTHYFDAELSNILRWHRHTELPLYRQLLSELKRDLKSRHSSVNGQQVVAYINQVLLSNKRTATYATPMLTELARQLSEKQIKGFIQELKKKHNKRIKAYQKMPSVERKLERRQGMEDLLDYWFDDVTKKQQKIIQQGADERDQFALHWLTYRSKWISELEQVLNDRQDKNFGYKLKQLIVDPVSVSLIYQQQSKQHRLLFSQRFADILTSLNEKQLMAFDEHIADVITDLTDLIGDG